MGKYDDTTDMAYSGDLASVAIPERRLFEETITAAGVPPPLRHRARLNLFATFVESVAEEVTAIRDRGFERVKRAEAWLARYEVGLKAVEASLEAS